VWGLSWYWGGGEINSILKSDFDAFQLRCAYRHPTHM